MPTVAFIDISFLFSCVVAFETFSRPLNPLRALSSSNLESSDADFVLRTEEQMQRTELVSKYNSASLELSEFGIECFVYSLTAIILLAILCVLVMFLNIWLYL